MTLTIIIIALLVLGIYLSTTWDYDILGMIFIVICIALAIFHIPSLMLKSYNYELFVHKRNAFEETLHNARTEGRELETAAIVKQVASWNTSLAQKKYDNSTFMFDCYIDDRIMDLKPIK